MKIGFFSKHPVSNNRNDSLINGDEILAEQLLKGLIEIDSNVEVAVYAPNRPPNPSDKIDIMIWMGDLITDFNIANKNVFYLQSGLPDANVEHISNKFKFDGFISYSKDALDKFDDIWSNTLYLPLCVDTDIYNPKQYESKFDYDVAYVGGSWKEVELYEKYLMPAIDFNFALFGSWREERKKSFEPLIENAVRDFYKIRWRHFIKDIEAIYGQYLKNKQSVMGILYAKCKGKIPQKDMPILYSSSKIILNFNAGLALKDNTITGRIMEALACKGFVISDRTPHAEEELKDCVIFTDGGKDLEEKIRYYLKYPEERKRIAQNGYEWCIKNATHKLAAKKLYEYLKNLGE